MLLQIIRDVLQLKAKNSMHWLMPFNVRESEFRVWKIQSHLLVLPRLNDSERIFSVSEQEIPNDELNWESIAERVRNVDQHDNIYSDHLYT